ncbi:phosphotransferase family protein [Microbacterium sp. MPKO10]|uniref:phosphotransferase family protein n=1 Tax=Microbacterium sp. MPKO10 TaxID=2989818 RepID=UPI00223640A0|nr:aminoglycoside phosphotransferase family protein [Microbacterium sp. MPKO10]MCW4457584.1 aminoglycoside phosphotransferase family protein [Microbacterium sp. MPKO10]
MDTWHHGLLETAPARFVEQHLSAPVLVDDLSWGLVDTAVLWVRDGDRDVIVKTAGPGNHHIGREITANESYTSPLVGSNRTGRLIAADRTANTLILSYQHGNLIDGTVSEFDPDVYAQAGAVLRELHGQESRVDDDYEIRVTDRAVRWLDGEHRIAPDVEAEARSILSSYRPMPITVVPTHGDWQPRNWLIDNGWLRVIDFGRFAFRPPATDLCRIAEKQWRENPVLEDAFVAGFGRDPRDEFVWPMDLLREAIGTACWAFQVGDADFEEHGLRLLDEAIARF